jgi:hypothetical protein
MVKTILEKNSALSAKKNKVWYNKINKRMAFREGCTIFDRSNEVHKGVAEPTPIGVRILTPLWATGTSFSVMPKPVERTAS